MNRNQIVGIRTTNEFMNRFDELCERLGHNRSEVIRFCLNKFVIEHLNSPEKFKKSKSELF